MKEVIIICIIITLLYLIYIFRYYILWFLNNLKVTINNEKNLKRLQNKGMNKRNLTNEQIIEYIKYSTEKLKEKNIVIKKGFILNQELERHLRYSRFSEKYVLELLNEILDYMELDKENIELKVNYISSKYAIDYAGLYSEPKNKISKKKIVVNIKNDMSMNTVISILAHECTHHLLLSNDIKLEETIKNECLTDITAIIMGFGKFMVEGYKISNRVTYDSEYYRYVDKNYVGYLSHKDIEYVIKKLNHKLNNM